MPMVVCRMPSNVTSDTSAHQPSIWHPPEQCIVLQNNPYDATEDWSGITNQKERKKLQNRLNKRLSRQRKRQDAVSKKTSGDLSVVDSTARCLQDMTTACNLANVYLSFTHCTVEDVAQKRDILKRFSEQALASYTVGNPRAEHHLRLIQLNTINGLTRNAAALGFSFDWLICEMVSPFGRDGHVATTLAFTMTSTPITLLPTEAQLKKTHHPWLDLLPLPRIRQNFFEIGSRLTPEDEEIMHDQLYRDIIETGGSQQEWVGLAVWGDPWDPRSWEMSQPFVRRWAWLIRGCPELVASTNQWRDLRGEKPIAVPSFVYETDG